MSSERDRRRERLSGARFYAILDLGSIDAARAVELATVLASEATVDLIQLRAKGVPLDQVAALALRIRATLPPQGPLFILNDHPQIAATVPVDGIHLGQDDLALAPARALLGPDGAGLIWGKSTHSLAQAIRAEEEGADYIGVGPIYATPTKPDYVPVGLDLIAQVRGGVSPLLPQFCIGGIGEQTLDPVLAAGGRRIVIVSELLRQRDVLGYCRRIRERLDRRPLSH